MKTGSYSIAGMPRVMQSQPGDTSPPVTIMNDGGVPVFNNKPSVDQMKEKMFYMNNSTSATTNNKRNGKFGMQWSEIFKRSINDNLFFKEIIEDSVVNTWFDPNDSLSTQLKMVTRIMKQKSVIGNEREFFYVTKNDWDTHFDQVAKLDWKFPRLNDSIQSLVNELKDQNVWDQTTVIVTSEFGRTLTPNSGQGTGKFITYVVSCRNIYDILSRLTYLLTSLHILFRSRMGWKLLCLWWRCLRKNLG